MDKSLAHSKAVELSYAFLSVHFPKTAKKLKKEAGLKDARPFAEPDTLPKLAAWYLDLPRARKNMGPAEVAATAPRDMLGDPADSVWSFEWESDEEEAASATSEALDTPLEAEETIAAVETVEVAPEPIAKPSKKDKKRKKADIEAAEVVPEVNGDVPPVKKAKLESATEPLSVNGKASKKKGKKESVPNQPFRRVRAEEVTFTDERLRDNTFSGSGAGQGDYGFKAHRDLIVTRGDGFRKGKAKFKRGKHQGGEITMESRSIKFE